MSFTPFMVQTACGSRQEAESIARTLLEEKLAACVQISEIDSFYEWKKELCEDREYLLGIKTKKENYQKIQSKIKENHSYDLPEIIGFKITKISKEYKEFINRNC